MRDKNGVNPDRMGGREKVRGVEGEEAMIRLYYMSKNSIFSKMKQIKKLTKSFFWDKVVSSKWLLLHKYSPSS